MVYSELYLIEGFVVDEKEMKDYIGTDEDVDISNIVCQGVDIYKFPCCSKSNGRKYIIGVKHHTYYSYHTKCFRYIGSNEKYRNWADIFLLEEFCKQNDIEFVYPYGLGYTESRDYMEKKWNEIKRTLDLSSPARINGFQGTLQIKEQSKISLFDICGVYDLCDTCIGLTNNGLYPVQKILDEPVECDKDFVCYNCGHDNKEIYEKCFVCNLSPLQCTEEQRIHREKHNLNYNHNVVRARRCFNLKDRKIAFYYMLNDCISCD